MQGFCDGFDPKVCPVDHELGDNIVCARCQRATVVHLKSTAACCVCYFKRALLLQGGPVSFLVHRESNNRVGECRPLPVVSAIHPQAGSSCEQSTMYRRPLPAGNKRWNSVRPMPFARPTQNRDSSPLCYAYIPTLNPTNTLCCTAQSSRVRSASSCKFGTGDRFNELKPLTNKNHLSVSMTFSIPGPGTYVV